MVKNSIFWIACIVSMILLGLIFIQAMTSSAEASVTDIPTIPTTSIVETIPEETTEPIPTTPTRPSFRNDFEYIPNLDKEENIKYRIHISSYIADLFLELSQLDIKAENYDELSKEYMDKIKELRALDFKYYNDYQAILEKEEEEAKWAVRMTEYPVATQVWLYLVNELEYSEAAAAGIIGNMMAECGGHTLKLEWWIYNPSKHYGLCQWSSKYYPQMQGASLEEQLAFMKESFPDVIERYGYLYKKGFTYNDFITMDNCGDAAIAFCKIYERPGGNQEYRRGLAQKAYEYFVG